MPSFSTVHVQSASGHPVAGKGVKLWIKGGGYTEVRYTGRDGSVTISHSHTGPAKAYTDSEGTKSPERNAPGEFVITLK